MITKKVDPHIHQSTFNRIWFTYRRRTLLSALTTVASARRHIAGCADNGYGQIGVMSRWNFFGGGSTDELPDTIQSKRGTTGDSAFEVFIEGALSNIYNAANGRSQEQKRIRESCKRIIGAILRSPMSTSDGQFLAKLTRRWLPSMQTTSTMRMQMLRRKSLLLCLKKPRRRWVTCV